MLFFVIYYTEQSLYGLGGYTYVDDELIKYRKIHMEILSQISVADLETFKEIIQVSKVLLPMYKRYKAYKRDKNRARDEYYEVIGASCVSLLGELLEVIQSQLYSIDITASQLSALNELAFKCSAILEDEQLLDEKQKPATEVDSERVDLLKQVEQRILDEESKND